MPNEMFIGGKDDVTFEIERVSFMEDDSTFEVEYTHAPAMTDSSKDTPMNALNNGRDMMKGDRCVFKVPLSSVDDAEQEGDSSECSSMSHAHPTAADATVATTSKYTAKSQFFIKEADCRKAEFHF